MSYSPTIDFLGLLRQTSGGIELSRMPGLDYVVAALARANLFNLFVGQTAPIVNQATTVWLKPALPSWTAEGVVYIWNPATQQYETATATLWSILFAQPNTYAFASVGAASGVIPAGTSLIAVQRTAPVTTALLLPNLAAQFASGRKLQIIDFSTSVVGHTITLSTPDGSTIMKASSWRLLSTADQFAGVSLQPSPDLNAWIIAP